MGIVVGSSAPAKSNVLLNIYGATRQGKILQPINLIQIYSGTVSDLAAMAVGNAGRIGTNTIQDLQTSKNLADPYVGMYILGESNSGSGNSRFTTSPNAATWAVGSAAPSGGCAASNLGSLYSLTPATGTAAHLWVCENNLQWTPVK